MSAVEEERRAQEFRREKIAQARSQVTRRAALRGSTSHLVALRERQKAITDIPPFGWDEPDPTLVGEDQLP